MTEYSRSLAELIRKYPNFIQPVNWDSKFKVPSSLVNQRVLDDAASKYTDIHSMFQTVIPNVPVQIRKPKTLKRFATKVGKFEDKEQIDGYFKSISDLIAVRIPVRTSEDFLSARKTLTDLKHISCLRNSIVGDDGKINDIAEYHFFYLPKVGHIVEVQLIHPFAAYAFMMNSRYRDGKQQDNDLELWDMYNDTQKLILDKWNGTQNSADFFNPVDALVSLYEANGKSAGDIPAELMDIVKSI